MGYGLYVISPVTGLSCHRRLADIRLSSPVGPDTSLQDLTPASGRQDHTISPSAPVPPKLSPDLVPIRPVSSKTVSSIVRPRTGRSLTGKTRPAISCAPDAVASIASHRAFVTFAKRPLSGETANLYE